jgi:hypothetical protein
MLGFWRERKSFYHREHRDHTNNKNLFTAEYEEIVEELHSREVLHARSLARLVKAPSFGMTQSNSF